MTFIPDHQFIITPDWSDNRWFSHGHMHANSFLECYSILQNQFSDSYRLSSFRKDIVGFTGTTVHIFHIKFVGFKDEASLIAFILQTSELGIWELAGNDYLDYEFKWDALS